MSETVKGLSLGPRVKDVVPTDNFELLLTFNTGEKKIFDAKTLFQYPMYAPLKNIAFLNWLRRIICVCTGMTKLISARMNCML